MLHARTTYANGYFDALRRQPATSCHTWPRSPAASHHLLGSHPCVELVACHETELDRDFSQRLTLLVRSLRDLGGIVVADVRIQSGDEHQRIVEILLDAHAVRLDANDAVLAQAVGSVGQEANALQEVVN